MTARLLRLLLRLPRSSAAARATDHDTIHRDAVCVILATYIGARYGTMKVKKLLKYYNVLQIM